VRSAVFRGRRHSCPLEVELPVAADEEYPRSDPGMVMGAGRIAEGSVNDEWLGFTLAEGRLAIPKRPTGLLLGRRSGTDTVS